MDMRYDSPLVETIRNALVNAQELLLVIASDSIKSQWIMCEGGAGWSLGECMVPTPKSRADSLPEPIKGHQVRKIDTTTERELG